MLRESIIIVPLLAMALISMNLHITIEIECSQQRSPKINQLDNNTTFYKILSCIHRAPMQAHELKTQRFKNPFTKTSIP